MSKLSKVESGAQLLARLGPRPTVQGLIPAAFGFEPSPGDVVELYGDDGAGKTELLLLMVTSVVLPARWRHYCLHGNKAQVVWVDTDLKFSVLRLAVLLERRILSALQSSSKTGLESGASDSKCAENVCASCDDGRGRGYSKAGMPTRDKSTNLADSAVVECDHKSNKAPSDEEFGKGHYANPTPGKKRTFDCLNNDADTSDMDRPQGKPQYTKGANGEKLRTKPAVPQTTAFKMPQHCDDKTLDRRKEDGVSDQSRTVHKPVLSSAVDDAFDGQTQNKPDRCVEGEMTGKEGEITGEEVEALVQECLERVHVVHCTSSQQLICTLHSLDATIAANRNISLLVVDSISAFFWSDKCRVDHSSSFLYKTMSSVAVIMRKIAQTYRVLVAVTKQALIKPKHEEDRGERSNSSTLSRGGADSHVEFLGKVWSELVTKRFICTKVKSVASWKYGLLGGNGQHYFTVDENGVHVCS